MHDDHEVKRKLQSMAFQKADPHFRDRLENEFIHGLSNAMVGNEKNLQSDNPAGRKLIFSITAMAACLLLSFGFMLYKTGSDEESSEKIGTVSSQQTGISPGYDDIFVINLDKGKQAILAWDLDNFSPRWYQSGESIGASTLANIGEDTFTLKDRQGGSFKNNIQQWNQSVSDALTGEVAGLQQKFAAGRFEAADWSRLQSIAYLTEGDKSTAFRLIESIADTPCAFQETAKEILADQKQIKYLREFSERALNPTISYREKRIATLGKFQSQIAIAALQAIVHDTNESEEIRSLAQKILNDMR